MNLKMKLKKLNKKTILIAAAALVVLAGLIVGVCVRANRKPQFYAVDQPDAKESAVTLLADHGLSALVPANTAPAFVQAGQNGYDGVRFEPRRTADGAWVVLEKENIRSVTDGSGRIGKLTYKQLLQHRVNKGKGLKAFRENPLTVPTLAQVLSVCSQYGMTPVIEVTFRDADELAKLFAAVGSRCKNDCCFLFSDGEMLAKARELLETDATPLKAKNVSLSLLVQKLDKKTLETAAKNPGVTVFFPADKGSAKQIARFTEAGLTLCACGVNKPKQLEKLTAAGVTMFLTDRLSHQPIEPEKDETTTAARMTAPHAKPSEGSTGKAAPTRKAAEKTTKKAAATKKAAERTTKKAAAAAKPTETTNAQ